MQKLTKLGDVYARYAGIIRHHAENGLPFVTLVSNADAVDQFYLHATQDGASKFVDSLRRQGINAAYAKTDPTAKDPRYGYTLYIKPTTGFGSFEL